MTLAEALTELEALKKEHSKATEKQEALQSENKTLHLRNLQLEEIIRHLKGKRFGSSSESLSHEQLLLLQEGLNDKASIPPIKETEVKAHTRKKGGRRPLPQHIERERVIHDLSDEEKVCSCGCGPLTKISEVSSEKLEIIPSKYKIIDHVRYKYACLHCKENVKLASLPPQLLPKTIATPSLIADIVSKKYVDALPLYRQEKIHHRHDLEISRASMAKWLIKVSHLLQPLINLIMDRLIENEYLQIDETPFLVLNEEGRKTKTKSYMWITRSGSSESNAVLFHYFENRNRKVLDQIISDFKGYLQTDGYKVYRMSFSSMIVLLGCFAHVRRKFKEAYDAAKKNEKSLAAEGLKMVQGIYTVEKNIREKDLTLSECFFYRIKHAKPLLGKLKTWCDENMDKVLPKSLTGKAIHYLKKEWPHLNTYLYDARLKIDNNACEQMIRPFALGRKNWLFSSTPAGAHASANFYSLVETAKLNKLEPYAYLHHIFERLPFCDKVEDYEKLLPWNVKNNSS